MTSGIPYLTYVYGCHDISTINLLTNLRFLSYQIVLDLKEPGSAAPF